VAHKREHSGGDVTSWLCATRLIACRDQPVRLQGCGQCRIRAASTARPAQSMRGLGWGPPQHRDLMTQDKREGCGPQTSNGRWRFFPAADRMDTRIE